MTWFKVDDGLHSHPKWLAASPRARALWTTAGSWCADNLTDGYVSETALRHSGGTLKDAAELVEVGLWEVVTDGPQTGWLFHEWAADGRQPTRAKVLAARKKTAERVAAHRERRDREKKQQ